LDKLSPPLFSLTNWPLSFDCLFWFSKFTSIILREKSQVISQQVLTLVKLFHLILFQFFQVMVSDSCHCLFLLQTKTSRCSLQTNFYQFTYCYFIEFDYKLIWAYYWQVHVLNFLKHFHSNLKCLRFLKETCRLGNDTNHTRCLDNLLDLKIGVMVKVAFSY